MSFCLQLRFPRTHQWYSEKTCCPGTPRLSAVSGRKWREEKHCAHELSRPEAGTASMSSTRGPATGSLSTASRAPELNEEIRFPQEEGSSSSAVEEEKKRDWNNYQVIRMLPYWRRAAWSDCRGRRRRTHWIHSIRKISSGDDRNTTRKEIQTNSRRCPSSSFWGFRFS